MQFTNTVHMDTKWFPDAQVMLSAAAYKAMRDARNKLELMRLRKSLSRRAKGFGSTAREWRPGGWGRRVTREARGRKHEAGEEEERRVSSRTAKPFIQQGKVSPNIDV